MNKVSVVIPAYNAERTIERTVRSVLVSTIVLDVWIVNDGSTDRTWKIADRLAAEESRVRVLHQENCGAYQARLNALKQIKTPYFGFVDADDTVEPTMFEKMVDFAEKEQLDVVQCVRLGKCDRGERREGVVEGTELERYKSDYLVNSRENCFIWDKLYRNQFDFAAFDPTDRVTNFDDMIFNLQFFLKVRRMGFLNEPLYHYATTEGSAVHSFSESKVKDFREVVRVRRALLPQYGVDPDGAENRAWFKLNRVNCMKATIRAGNLTWAQKVSVIGKLMKVSR